jgi:hypothetical protein
MFDDEHSAGAEMPVFLSRLNDNPIFAVAFLL